MPLGRQANTPISEAEWAVITAHAGGKGGPVFVELALVNTTQVGVYYEKDAKELYLYEYIYERMYEYIYL